MVEGRRGRRESEVVRPAASMLQKPAGQIEAGMRISQVCEKVPLVLRFISISF